MDYDKRKKFIVNFLYIAIIILLSYMVIQYGLKLITPFLFAFLIAYFLRKPAMFISKKLKLPYKLVVVLIVILFYCTIGVLLSLLGVKLFSTLTDVIASLPDAYTAYIEPFLASFFDGIEKAVYRMDAALVSALNDIFTQFMQSLGELISNVSMRAVGFISGYASSLPALFIKILLMIISSFFIVIDYDKLREFVMRQFSGKGKGLVISIKEYVVGTLFVCIRSYAIIMSITFVELSIGFSILKIEKAIIVAFLISILDILPVLGTGGIIIPWAIILAIQGNYALAIGLGVLYIVITVIRNILEPKIVGSQIGLHPVVTLISMFVGVQVFGVLGLFGFPILLSLLRHLNDTGTIKLFK